MSKLEDIRKMVIEELDAVTSFMSADETQGFGYTQSQAEERTKYLEKLLKVIDEKMEKE